MKQLENTGTIETITCQALATRMRITPKRLRAILRAEFQRDIKYIYDWMVWVKIGCKYGS